MVSREGATRTGPAPRAAVLRERAAWAREKFRPGGIGSDTMWAMGTDVFMLVVSVLSFVLLGAGLGPEGYGDYVAIFAVTGIAGVLATSGTGLSLMEHAVREREDLGLVARSCLSMGLASGALLGVVALTVITLIVDSVTVPVAATFVVAELVGGPLIVVAADALRVRRGFGSASRVRIAWLAAKVLVLLGLHAMGELRLAVLGPTMMVVSVGVGLIALVVASRAVHVRITPGRLDRRHLRTAGLYAGGLTALAFQNDGDKTVMAASAAARDAGLYAAAYKIVQFGLVPMNSLMSSSHQRFLDHDTEAEGQHTRRTIKYTAVAAAYGVVFAIGTFVFAPFITRLLPDEFADAESVVRLLAPLVLARSVSVFALNGLLGLGRTGLRSALMAASAALAMVLYVVLIPSMGSTGAVLGTLISEGLAAVVGWLFLVRFQRRHDLGVRARREAQFA